jgi:hypothetical protein
MQKHNETMLAALFDIFQFALLPHLLLLALSFLAAQGLIQQSHASLACRQTRLNL